MHSKLNENLDILIKNWFYNLNNRTINEEILVLIYSGKLEDVIKFNYPQKYEIQTNYSSYKFINYSKLNDNNFHQIIIVDNMQHIYFDLERLDKKMIVVPSEHNFFKNPKEYLNPQSYNEISPNENELNSWYLKKENILELIQYSEPKDLHNLIINKLILLSKIYKNINNIVTQDITIENSIPNDNLYTDIEMLRNHKILTARLAVIIYRIFSFRFNANITEIGRKINLITGIKSKSFTFKMIANLSKNSKVVISSDLIKKKSFKAYNLNVNEVEHKIRIEIANELLSFGLKELSFDLISKATKLPIETIKKLDSKFY